MCSSESSSSQIKHSLFLKKVVQLGTKDIHLQHLLSSNNDYEATNKTYQVQRPSIFIFLLI